MTTYVTHKSTREGRLESMRRREVRRHKYAAGL